jgi:hypothetical protein
MTPDVTFGLMPNMTPNVTPDVTFWPDAQLTLSVMPT